MEIFDVLGLVPEFEKQIRKYLELIKNIEGQNKSSGCVLRSADCGPQL